MRDTLIEKVARAMWDEACPGLTWGEADQLIYLNWAKEAIKAMHEPTERMIESAIGLLVGPSPGHLLDKDDAAEVWRIMIETAYLNDGLPDDLLR